MDEDPKRDRSDDDPLSECEQTVEALKEENQLLKESAMVFGELAERLNQRQPAPGEDDDQPPAPPANSPKNPTKGR